MIHNERKKTRRHIIFLIGVAEKTPSGNLATDIPGLRSRISNPLDMLGLYGTSHEACHRHHIPALCITGDASEEQILAAGKVQRENLDPRDHEKINCVYSLFFSVNYRLTSIEQKSCKEF
jgi:hypothetical protein